MDLDLDPPQNQSTAASLMLTDPSKKPVPPVPAAAAVTWNKVQNTNKEEKSCRRSTTSNETKLDGTPAGAAALIPLRLSSG